MSESHFTGAPHASFCIHGGHYWHIVRPQHRLLLLKRDCMRTDFRFKMGKGELTQDEEQELNSVFAAQETRGRENKEEDVK
ncbi:hypothetical protein NPIL_608901 [Nephila pilipes]|uniref:Uncharacterized protein n=1 Tax=Nephila pilipes TaxID=299642 RepID=A0A8X6IZD1_NEPPI|nr:hypothetical protein NPIL_608901 [Nephila pilipes]